MARGSIQEDHAITAAIKSLEAGEPVVAVNPWLPAGLTGLCAEDASAEWVNFLIRECRGLLYVGLSRSRLDQLQVPHQHFDADRTRSGPFHVRAPVDVRSGVTTGISASDRAATVRALLDPESSIDEFHVPGHVTPIELQNGGVLGHLGLPETVQDVARIAGRSGGVVVCGILDEGGELAGSEYLHHFGRRFGMPVVSITDVVRHRRRQEGWSGPPKEMTSLDLPFLGLRAVIALRGAYRVVESFPVTLLPLCLPGLTLGDGCACRHRLTRALDALKGTGTGAVGIVWRPDDEVPSCDVPGLKEPWQMDAAAQLVSAMFAAGAQTPPLIS